VPNFRDLYRTDLSTIPSLRKDAEKAMRSNQRESEKEEQRRWEKEEGVDR